jgi:glucokinase
MTFDIGGTNVKYAVVNSEAEIVEKGKFPTPKTGIEDLISSIGQVTRSYSDKYSFLGLAMSFPGSVNNETGFINGISAVRYIHGPNIRELLEKETGFKVSLENDANCAALAEVWKGVAKDAKDVLFVVCGTGIGGAVIKDKKLHTGKHLFGGEFGFMIMEKNYETGEFQTWSGTASTIAMVRNAAKLKGVDMEELDGEKVFKLAEQGDEACQKAIDMFYKSLAEGIYNLQYSFDPEMIVIGGAISAREDLISEIHKRLDYLNEHVATAMLRDIRVEKCAYSNDANIIGAVYNFMNTFQ